MLFCCDHPPIDFLPLCSFFLLTSLLQMQWEGKCKGCKGLQFMATASYSYLYVLSTMRTNMHLWPTDSICYGWIPLSLPHPFQSRQLNWSWHWRRSRGDQVRLINVGLAGKRQELFTAAAATTTSSCIQASVVNFVWLAGKKATVGWRAIYDFFTCRRCFVFYNWRHFCRDNLHISTLPGTPIGQGLKSFTLLYLYKRHMHIRHTFILYISLYAVSICPDFPRNCFYCQCLSSIDVLAFSVLGCIFSLTAFLPHSWDVDDTTGPARHRHEAAGERSKKLALSPFLRVCVKLIAPAAGVTSGTEHRLLFVFKKVSGEWWSMEISTFHNFSSIFHRCLSLSRTEILKKWWLSPKMQPFVYVYLLCRMQTSISNYYTLRALNVMNLIMGPRLQHAHKQILLIIHCNTVYTCYS